MIYNNILEAIGNTPLIQLQHIVPENSARILVKFEGLNVGGSIKTRTALNMILDAEQKGLINKDTTTALGVCYPRTYARLAHHVRRGGASFPRAKPRPQSV